MTQEGPHPAIIKGQFKIDLQKRDMINQGCSFSQTCGIWIVTLLGNSLVRSFVAFGTSFPLSCSLPKLSCENQKNIQKHHAYVHKKKKKKIKSDSYKQHSQDFIILNIFNKITVNNPKAYYCSKWIIHFTNIGQGQASFVSYFLCSNIGHSRKSCIQKSIQEITYKTLILE